MEARRGFFFNDTATTEIYTLSLHDALPISHSVLQSDLKGQPDEEAREELLLRTRAQLADPDFSGVSDLKSRRGQRRQPYLYGGSSNKWEEVHRDNAQAAHPPAASKTPPLKK